MLIISSAAGLREVVPQALESVEGCKYWVYTAYAPNLQGGCGLLGCALQAKGVYIEAHRGV